MTQEEYPEQYTVIKNLMSDIKVNCPIYIYESNQYTGIADKPGVFLPTAVINDFIERPYVLRFFAAHELVHYKNKDYGLLFVRMADGPLNIP